MQAVQALSEARMFRARAPACLSVQEHGHAACLAKCLLGLHWHGPSTATGHTSMGSGGRGAKPGLHCQHSWGHLRGRNALVTLAQLRYSGWAMRERGHPPAAQGPVRVVLDLCIPQSVPSGGPHW
eukprot:15179911-Alexandrium_andersonii.AAC.1